MLTHLFVSYIISTTAPARSDCSAIYVCVVCNATKQLKTKLIVVLLVLVAVFYVSPMTFDHSLRVASSASQLDGVTMATLADDVHYRLFYLNASSLFVVAVPLVCLLGLAMSLPTIGKTLGRSAAESRRGQFGSQFIVQSPLQQASSGVGGLIDVIGIATVLTLLLFLAYVPQVSC